MKSNSGVLDKISDQTINNYKPLVKSIARKYINSGEPVEDLEQIAYLGLLNAFQLFNEKKGVKFETYATWLINGEIRHYIRDKHAVVKVPHWIKEFNKKINKYIEKFRKEYHRFPSLSEIGDYFNVTEEGIREILKGRETVQIVSLDSKRRNNASDSIPIFEQIRSKEYRSFQLPIEDSIQLKNALNSLKKVQKEVIYYLFFKDLTQTSTARKLGITQRQVSRIKQEAIDELRKNLKV